MKPISIVVPALNEQDYLPILLQSFIDQEFDGVYEIIVVDGGSTDNTVAVVKQYQSRLPQLSVYVSEPGISRQRNFGAQRAKYDSLVFLDADMKLSKKSLSKIEKHFQTKDNFTAVPILFPYDSKLVDVFLGIVGYGMFLYVRKHNPVLAGMCIITTKQLHDRIGGFNESAVVAEDVDYGLRAHKSGAKYYILFNVLIRGSARRLDQMGRWKLARTWGKWYKRSIESGPITDASIYEYEFGKFKKN